MKINELLNEADKAVPQITQYKQMKKWASEALSEIGLLDVAVKNATSDIVFVQGHLKIPNSKGSNTFTLSFYRPETAGKSTEPITLKRIQFSKFNDTTLSVGELKYGADFKEKLKSKLEVLLKKLDTKKVTEAKAKTFNRAKGKKAIKVFDDNFETLFPKFDPNKSDLTPEELFWDPETDTYYFSWSIDGKGHSTGIVQIKGTEATMMSKADATAIGKKDGLLSDDEIFVDDEND